jgi:predicted outer membrane repeat protein
MLSAGTVTGNTATAAGGGIFSLGTVEVNSSTLSNNTAIQGGGFNNQGDTATVTSIR